MGEGAGKNHFFRKKVFLCHYLGQVMWYNGREDGFWRRKEEWVWRELGK